MLRSVKDLTGYRIHAKDGEIGKVEEFYFDDEDWTIRYLVVDTGDWLPGRKVLIAPAAFYGQPEWDTHTFPVILTKEMVKRSPDINTDKPVSRQKEFILNNYYGWPIYWDTDPAYIPPADISIFRALPSPSDESKGDIHLRRTKEVIGYHIQAKDGDIGHAHDFIIDDEGWAIRYVVVDTRNWLPGKKVLIASQWIEEVSWSELKLHISLTEEEIRESPGYDPSAPVNRKYEEVLYDYYGRSKYWK